MAVSCSESEDSLSRDDAPRVAAEARCNVAAGCECGSEALNGDACVSLEEMRFRSALETAEASGYSYDPECGSALIPELWDGCASLAEMSMQPSSMDLEPGCGTCTRYLFGELGRGESCGSSPLGCEKGLTCLRGVCADPCDPVSEGEDCEASFCEAGLTCVPGAAGWVCLSSDTGCGGGEPCADDAYCEGGAVCSPRREIGQSCSLDTCVAEAYCDAPTSGAEGTCVAKLGDGEPCTAAEQCVVGACDDGQCGPGAPLVCVFE
jgi:hypothetical protein